MSDRKAALDREAMRRMVREVLRDALPEAIKTSGVLRAAAERVAASPAPAPAEPPGKKQKPGASDRSTAERQAVSEEVSIQSDRDLAAFVRRLLQLLANPATAEAVRSGRHQFTLKRPAAANATAARPAPAAEKILKGVVKESVVIAAAKAGTRLVIGRGVVITPLARDKARQLGVQIERDV